MNSIHGVFYRHSGSPIAITAGCRSRRHGGFALIVALGTMLFCLLLALSLSALLRMETNVSVVHQAQMAARQNALLGVYVALGKLQETMGPDDRISVNASIFDPDPETSELSDLSNPYYLGVYPAMDSEVTQAETFRSQNAGVDKALAWLVSSQRPIDNPVSRPASDFSDRTVAMVTAPDSIADVLAGVVPIESSPGTINGGYAWWVSDESQKAKINTVRTSDVLGDKTEALLNEVSARLPSKASLDYSSDGELEGYDPSDIQQGEKLKRLVYLSDMPLIRSDWGDWISRHAHDLTTSSFSVPVDVTRRRLKEDLSVFLQTGAGVSASDKLIYSNLVPGVSTSMLPDFSILRSWYQTGMQRNSSASAVAPTASGPRQVRLAPVLAQIMFKYIAAPKYIGGTSDVEIAVLMQPMIKLWNPYNIPLDAGDYVIQFSTWLPLRFSAWDPSLGEVYSGDIQGAVVDPDSDPLTFYRGPAGDGSLVVEWDEYLPNHDPLAADPLEPYPDGRSRTYLTFQIQDQDFLPGDALWFFPDQTGAGVYGQPYQTVDTNIPRGVNLLVNNNNQNAFYYLELDKHRISAGAPPKVAPVALYSSIGLADVETKSVRDAAPPVLMKLYRRLEDGSLELVQAIDAHQKWTAASAEKVPPNTFRMTRTLDQSLHNGLQPHYFHTGWWLTGYADDVLDAGSGARINSRRRLLANWNPAATAVIHSGVEAGWGMDSYLNWSTHSDGNMARRTKIDVLHRPEGYDGVGGSVLYQVDLGGGVAAPSGSVFPLFDFPRPDFPLLSLGRLQHVAFVDEFSAPAYAFGNSLADPRLARTSTVATDSVKGNLLDWSYLLNRSLWDRFYLSTIPANTDEDDLKGITLPNPRHKLDELPSTITSAVALTADRGFRESAARIAVDGGFNVNSTSVLAWKVLLSGIFNESGLARDNQRMNAQDTAPYGRLNPSIIGQPDQRWDQITEGGNPLDNSASWLSKRTLTGEDIEALATRIVEEVKKRGPFLSVADFVNRRLVADGGDLDQDMQGLMGTLQAAIERVTFQDEGINHILMEEGAAELFDDSDELRVTDTERREHLLGVSSQMSGAIASKAAHTPPFITQADVLEAIGPLLTVRGDTFVIRSYGETLAPDGNGVMGKAWCEAVVQRLPDPVIQGEDFVEPSGPLGRRFIITAFRWIDAP